MIHSRRKWGIASVIGFIITGSCIWTYSSYRRDIEALREDVATGSEIAETACGPIEYAVAGDGPPVLVVHGAGGGYDQGLLLAESLVARGFRVIAVSRFGYLRTPLPADASATVQADAHACVLDALGIAHAAILGASAGAPSTAQFALRHPDRTTALVLLVPALYVPREDDAAPIHAPRGTVLLFDTALKWDFGFWAALRLAPRMMTRTLLGTPPERVEEASASEQTRVATLLTHILPVSQRRLGLENDGSIVPNLERYALERITAPTLIVSVADDGYGTFDVASYTAGQIPGARFIGYARGGHVLVGHQDELTKEIEAFLR